MLAEHRIRPEVVHEVQPTLCLTFGVRHYKVVLELLKLISSWGIPNSVSQRKK